MQERPLTIWEVLHILTKYSALWLGGDTSYCSSYAYIKLTSLSMSSESLVVMLLLSKCLIAL